MVDWFLVAVWVVRLIVAVAASLFGLTLAWRFGKWLFP